ncbi:MAG: HAMP domain-containing protein [Deltaproteobacteria bacterium]|nr:HAMP domain-containing protein [Deltaproteobacteria bacterium]
MKLRGRFTLWFSIAALVPIAAATLITREVLSRSYRTQFEDERQLVERRAKNLVAEISMGVAERIGGQASSEHPLVGGLLLELEKHGGQLPALEKRQLVQQGSSLMDALDLDVLFVLDGSDTVLVSPHNRGDRDSFRPELRERAQRAQGSTYFALEPTIRGDTIEAVLVVEAGRTVRRDGQSVTIIGGKTLGEPELVKLRDGRRTDARVVDATGEALLAPARKWSSGGRLIRVPLPGPDDKPVAWVEVTVSDSELGGLLREVTVSSFVLGGGALLLTIIFGFVIARRITGDLDALVDGAQAVSRDDYDYRIDVRSRDEIGAVAEAFNGMLQDLQESKDRLVIAERIAAWQEIARSLAHEIKNPLTPIQMSVETMRRSHAKEHPSFEEIFDESTKTILEETDRLKRIVSEFSEFARMPKASKQSVDLNEIVRSAVALYMGSVKLEVTYDEGLSRIDADRDQLTQVLLNLLENSRDAITAAGDGDGRILVQTRLAGGGKAVELLVGDNGPGIPEKLKGKVFTPYFTTKGQRGTGLGLATVHRIISDHGGRIRVDDSSMGGAEFVIALPTGTAPLALTFRSVPRD